MSEEHRECQREWTATKAGRVVGEPDFDMRLLVSAYMDGSSTFIVEVHGKVTLPVLEEIEKQLAADAEERDDHRQTDVVFRVTRFVGGEKQYGTGYGSIYVLPGYWEYDEVGPAEQVSLPELCEQA